MSEQTEDRDTAALGTTRVLVLRFDVTALTRRQVEALAFAASVQGEASEDAPDEDTDEDTDPEGLVSYPDVPFLGHETVTI